jgi:hypothetical protein
MTLCKDQRGRAAKTGTVVGLLVLAWSATPACAQAQEGLKVSGSYKTLLLGARPTAAPRYGLDFNRLRLEVQGPLSRFVTVDLQYDNELLLGSYLRSDEFRAAKDLRPPQYWDAQANYLDSSRAYGQHRLHRAALTVAAGNVDVRVGRQRIAWGTGRFWSPLDILNPVSPTALEREERAGVDALLVDAKLGPLSRLSLVYAPDHDARRSSRAMLWHGNRKGVDYSVAAGRLRGQDVVGLDLAGQLGSAGIRAEATRQRPTGRDSFTRLMIGLDYAWPSTLTVSVEGYYNGAGSRHRPYPDTGVQATDRLLGLATRYLGLFAGVELSPTLKWNNYWVFNADDSSRALDSRLVWSVQQDLDLTLGLRHFAGNTGSEFARLPNSALIQLQWFF